MSLSNSDTITKKPKDHTFLKAGEFVRRASSLTMAVISEVVHRLCKINIKGHERYRKEIAYHEAGHLVAFLLEGSEINEIYIGNLRESTRQKIHNTMGKDKLRPAAYIIPGAAPNMNMIFCYLAGIASSVGKYPGRFVQKITDFDEEKIHDDDLINAFEILKKKIEEQTGRKIETPEDLRKARKCLREILHRYVDLFLVISVFRNHEELKYPYGYAEKERFQLCGQLFEG